MQAQEAAFSKLKTLMIETPVFVYPDSLKDYIIDINASADGIGAVHLQCLGGGQSQALA